MAAVTIRGLRKEFVAKRRSGTERVVALDGIDLTVAAGELLVLVGPSGCGKTTLLRCLAGLEHANEGVIMIGDQTVFNSSRRLNVQPNHRDIGMVFQKYALWPHMSVLQNVEYPLRSKKRKQELKDGRALQALESVRCEIFAERIPAELSGGQQQRIALARATVGDPTVLLLDEPLSNLDALLRLTLREELRKFHRTVGFTGVYVTHDQSEALSLGDRVAVMQSGQIQQLAAPQEVFDRPATPDVATFIGIRNKFRVEPVGQGWKSECGPLNGFSAANAASYELFARPEAITLSPGGTDADRPADGLIVGQGRIEETLFCGDAMEFIVDVNGKSIIAVAPRQTTPLVLGDAVWVGIREGRSLLYKDGVLVSDGDRSAPPVGAVAVGN